MTYNITWNSRDGGYNIDREGHGYLISQPTIAECVAWIVEGYGYEESNDRFTINYQGDLFA